MKKIISVILVLIMSFTFICCGKSDVVEVEDGAFDYDVLDFIEDMDLNKDDTISESSLGYEFPVNNNTTFFVVKNKEEKFKGIMIRNTTNIDDTMMSDIKKYLNKAVELLNSTINMEDVYEELNIQNANSETKININRDNLTVGVKGFPEQIVVFVNPNDK